VDDAAVKKVARHRGRAQRMSNQAIHRAHLITVRMSIDTQGTLKNKKNVHRYTRHT
jgi:hypothetical protein